MRIRSRSSTSVAATGKGCGIVFGVIWTLFSSIFVVVGLGLFWKSEKVRGWEEVPCEIERFEILDDPDADPPFTVDLVFRFRSDGSWREGTRLRNEEGSGDGDFDDLARLRAELISQEATCRVNPDDPTDAVLTAGGEGTWGGLFFAAFGGFFVLVGVGLILGALRSGKASKAKSSSSEDGEMGGLLGFGFFGIFAAAGVGMFFGLIVPKGIDYFAMKGWVETPAEVLWSRVRSHSDDDGTTYSADVFYRYRFEGRDYRSNRRGVMGGSSSGRASKQRFVDAHPAGASIVCYVDPDDPNRAVLERRLGWWALFALFPLPFAAIGLGGLWWMFVGRKRKARKAGTRSTGKVIDSESGEDELVTKGGSVGRRLLGLLGAILLAAFWNGIVSVFVWQAQKEWQRGGSPWFLTIFLIPFVLIGIGLIIHIFYRFFAIFSPRYAVSIGNRHLTPGAGTTVSWRREGGGGEPRRLSWWLVGREEATYRRGTDTRTDTAIFFERSLFDTQTRLMMPKGEVELSLPADAVPSFRGRHNKVRWFLLLHADVPGRPDVRDEYEVDVKPD